MRKLNLTFKELVLENKKQLLNDPQALSEIDKRIEEKKIKASSEQK